MVCLLACIIFIGSGYLYLSHELKPAEIGEESVPYYNSTPENAGVMFDICSDRVLFYMDFEKNNMRVIFDPKITSIGANLYGYSVDYTISGNYDLLGYIIDVMGGIELESEEEILRYTGVQIADMLSKTADTNELSRKIISKLLEKIGEKGFGKENFLYIIENSETNLTVPDCYYWSDYMKSICRNATVIN